MKKCISVLLAAVLLIALFSGCSKTPTLSEGEDNGKMVGAWVVINETPGFRRIIRYWEFKSDNTVIIYDYVETVDSDTVNDQLYETAPYDDMYKRYYIDTDRAEPEVYPFSYTDGHGLEYQKSEDTIVDFVAEEGWIIEFQNDDLFYMTAPDGEIYHGYRLKEPLV